MALDRREAKISKAIDHYTYRITWSEEEHEHLGLCTEFPGLSWLEKAPEKALAGIRKLVRQTVEYLVMQNKTVPQAIAMRSCSGKFLGRVPPETHCRLAMQAAESGVSLNRLVSSKLAHNGG